MKNLGVVGWKVLEDDDGWNLGLGVLKLEMSFKRDEEEKNEGMFGVDDGDEGGRFSDAIVEDKFEILSNWVRC